MRINNALNNREISTAICLIIFFLWALSKSDIRHSILVMLKAFINKKIIFPLLVMLFYIASMVLFFKRIGFWDISATKDTILWTFGSAFVTFFSIHKITQDYYKFKNLILDNLKFILVLEFVVNLYSFSLIIELILIPIVSFFVMLNAFAESKPECKNVSKFLNFILGVSGIFILTFTIIEIVNDFQSFASLKNLRDLFLPPLFSIVLLPFVYIMALYMQYEMFFFRIDLANKNPEVQKNVKRKILLACHINLSKLSKVSKKAGYPKVNDKNDVFLWLM
jgi:hypothetical protein